MLTIAHSQLAEIAEKHGSPFYLYDMDAALRHVAAMREHLSPNVELLYAVKANPNPAVLRAYKPVVQGLDISSGGELEHVMALGFDPATTSFAGPGKTDHELAQAIEAGVGILSIESLHELSRAQAIAERLGATVPITLRINPKAMPREFAMKMGGQASQFGIAEEDVAAAMAAAAQAKNVRIKGIHVFAGTQCLTPDALAKNIQQTLGIAAALSQQAGIRFDVVNLGGGFGVPYFEGQEPMDVPELARLISATVGAFVEEHDSFAQTRFKLELGRFLIGMFGVYVARVVDVKETRGKRFAILDGGMNHCFAATGGFGQLIPKNYPIENVTAAQEAAPRESCAHELVGPLCTPMDSMGRKVTLPEVRVADLLAIAMCGAYSFTASPLLFLGHRTPAELVLQDGTVSVARERRTSLDF